MWDMGQPNYCQPESIAGIPSSPKYGDSRSPILIAGLIQITNIDHLDGYHQSRAPGSSTAVAAREA